MPICDAILGNHGGAGGGGKRGGDDPQSQGNGVVFWKDNRARIEEGQINNTEKLRLKRSLDLLSKLKSER